ncbi:MAG: thioredoxin-disulfide reductase [Candidatus Levybacteria bacterium]|nr:thioredoxin-disulfide reductase [Candidatus Levybacteria bacterium]MBP9815195.1 thioredoxin-disulfide reductase [Candidatus Levybacteria bacterium]
MENLYDVIIIGSGPAGLTAGIYTSRADLKTLIIAGRFWGGQLMLTTEVENFPGFPDGILGPELMQKMRKQAEHHGVEIVDSNFKSGDFSIRPFTITTDDEKTYSGKSVIVATGAETKWLGIPGEQEKIGRGVSSCAPCDAAFYRGKNVIVVGGGDSAMEEAEVLTKFAQHVYIVHRKDMFRASQIMQKRIFDNPKITVVWSSEITEIVGDQKVEKVIVKTTGDNIKVKENNQDSEKTAEDLGGKTLGSGSWEFPIDGVFVAVGHMPNSKVFANIETDEKGFIKTFDHTKTNLDGVFVAGDVHDAQYQQAVTAAAFGCMAGLDVEKWLRMQQSPK